jgi:hypothetical protein
MLRLRGDASPWPTKPVLIWPFFPERERLPKYRRPFYPAVLWRLGDAPEMLVRRRRGLLQSGHAVSRAKPALEHVPGFEWRITPTVWPEKDRATL